MSFPKQDPEHNRIAEWLDVKPRHGIVDLSFPLASEASLGMYAISVQQNVAHKFFRVDEYGETWTTKSEGRAVWVAGEESRARQSCSLDLLLWEKSRLGTQTDGS